MGLDEETEKVEYRLQQVKWEPNEGLHYAILYDKKVEVYKADSEEPVSYITSDVKFISMDYLNANEIIVVDVNGRFTLIKGI